MILHAERVPIGQFQPRIGAIEQRHVRLADVRRQAVALDREAVVHAGDLDGAIGQALDRVVGAAVTLEHLGCGRADREAEQLMAEADAEQRLARLQQLADHRHRVFGGRGGIAGAVRQEDAVGGERHHVVEAGGRAYDRDFRACLDEVAEDVALAAIIDRDDVGAGFT